jgi:hypothetical protein
LSRGDLTDSEWHILDPLLSDRGEREPRTDRSAYRFLASRHRNVWHTELALGGVVQLEQIHGGHQNILEPILRLGTDSSLIDFRR